MVLKKAQEAKEERGERPASAITSVLESEEEEEEDSEHDEEERGRGSVVISSSSSSGGGSGFGGLAAALAPLVLLGALLPMVFLLAVWGWVGKGGGGG